jgi:Zn-dependent oligopeptidase
VRCSRRVDEDDRVFAQDPVDEVLKNEEIIEIDGKRYQMPIVVLVTSFFKSENNPPLLSLSEVETLFHEFGLYFV